LSVVELLEKNHAFLPGLEDELAEPIEPGISLVEVGIDLLHDLFEPVGPHDIPIAGHLSSGLAGKLPRVALG
jgi:hypothetical protein